MKSCFVALEFRGVITVANQLMWSHQKGGYTGGPAQPGVSPEASERLRAADIALPPWKSTQTRCQLPAAAPTWQGPEDSLWGGECWLTASKKMETSVL